MIKEKAIDANVLHLTDAEMSVIIHSLEWHVERFPDCGAAELMAKIKGQAGAGKTADVNILCLTDEEGDIILSLLAWFVVYMPGDTGAEALAAKIQAGKGRGAFQLTDGEVKTILGQLKRFGPERPASDPDAIRLTAKIKRQVYG